MNVLQVVPAIAPRYGGPSEVVVSVTRALIDAGVDVQIVTTDADGYGRLPVGCGMLTDWNSVPVRFFRRQFSEAFKYSAALQSWLRTNVHRFDLVHIHAVFSHSSVAAYKACMDADVPYILRPLGSLDPETLSRKRLKKRLFNTVWGKGMLSNASALHYSTTREMTHVENRFGLKHGFVAPAGVAPCTPHSRFRHCSEVPSRLSQDAPYVVFLGRLDPIKQVELLIEAFASATEIESLADWRLVVAGDGNPDYSARIKKLANDSTAHDRISFTGWISGAEKSSVLSRAAMLMLLSKHENFGRSVAEAMAFGVPVFVSEGVYLADDVREHNAGWVVSDRLEVVSRTLREALQSSARRRTAGLAACELANQKFDLGRSTETLVSHYRDVTRS